MSTLRIYLVTDRNSDRQRLVRATSQAAARNHVARDSLGVALASQDTLVALVSKGTEVEDAGAELAETN